MIDLMNERLLPLGELSRAVPSRPVRSTVRRWAGEGIDGVVLETVRLGGRRYTSHEALARFLHRLNAGTQAGEAGPAVRAEPRGEPALASDP
jgi:hypothetical protein